MVAQAGIEPATQGFSVSLKTTKVNELKQESTLYCLIKFIQLFFAKVYSLLANSPCDFRLKIIVNYL